MVSGIFVLTFVLLSFPNGAVGHNAYMSSSLTSSEDGRLTEELRDIEETLGPHLAQRHIGNGELVKATVALVTQYLKSSEPSSAVKDKLQAMESLLQTTRADLERRLEATGSTFVRWGRKTCPSNTTLVYSGLAGGKLHTEKGSGTNRLCLTRRPQFDGVVATVSTSYGHIYGAEYQEIGGHIQNNVPCSVCRAPQSTTIMVPATHTCPPGWTTQFTGHLVSQYYNYYATEYVCLDGSPEDESSSKANENGLLFFYVAAKCGSLPCPPYIGGKVVTCAVCSK